MLPPKIIQTIPETRPSLENSVDNEVNNDENEENVRGPSPMNLTIGSSTPSLPFLTPRLNPTIPITIPSLDNNVDDVEKNDQNEENVRNLPPRRLPVGSKTPSTPLLPPSLNPTIPRTQLPLKNGADDVVNHDESSDEDEDKEDMVVKENG